MEEENPELNLPVLPRLNQLDRLVQLLEEKRNSLSNPVSREMEQQDDHCKTLNSALEEVHHKGTLIERLAALENRVLQLSIQMDDSNTSRSSSSAALVSENLGHDVVVSKVSRGENDENLSNQRKEQHPPTTQEDDVVKEPNAEPKGGKRKGSRKLFRMFRMGCN